MTRTSVWLLTLALCLAACGRAELRELRTRQYALQEQLNEARRDLETWAGMQARSFRMVSEARARALEGSTEDLGLLRSATEHHQGLQPSVDNSKERLRKLEDDLRAVESRIAALGEKP